MKLRIREFALAMLLSATGCISAKVHEVAGRLQTDYGVIEESTRLKDPPIPERSPGESEVAYAKRCGEAAEAWKTTVNRLRDEMRENLRKLVEVSR